MDRSYYLRDVSMTNRDNIWKNVCIFQWIIVDDSRKKISRQSSRERKIAFTCFDERIERFR